MAAYNISVPSLNPHGVDYFIEWAATEPQTECSTTGNPEFATILKVVRALELELHVQAAHT